MKRSYLIFSVAAICVLIISQFAYSAPGFVIPGYACSTWQVGQRVGLRGGTEIRQGSGLGYSVHTIVPLPEDGWQVDIIDGPRSADGYTWWDISRQNLDGGGTGWVYIEQAGYDVCNNNNNPPPSQPPAGFSFCAEEGNYCSFSGTADVAYGAQGSFYYAYSISGGINCSNDLFGDPIQGVHKTCYIKQVSAPPQSLASPSLSSPGNGTSWPQSTAVILRWNPSSGASSYKVELWGGPYSTMTPCDWQSSRSCTIGTMWPGTMSWKVKARDNNGNESDWSSTWSFTIQEGQQPQELPSQPPSNTQQPPNPQSPSNPNSSDPSQADACPGFVKDYIAGFASPPSGRYIYIPVDIDRLRLRKSHSGDSCAYGWLTPGNYYSTLNERSDGWIQIETSIGQGWIVGQYVELHTNEQQPQQPTQEPPSIPENLPSPDLEPAPEANHSAQLDPDIVTTNNGIAYPSSTNICVGGCNQDHENWIEFHLAPGSYLEGSLKLKTSLFWAKLLTVALKPSNCTYTLPSGEDCIHMGIRHSLLTGLRFIHLVSLDELRNTNNWWLEYTPSN